MAWADFWALIAEESCQRLAEALSTRSVPDIIGFAERHAEALYRLDQEKFGTLPVVDLTARDDSPFPQSADVFLYTRRSAPPRHRLPGRRGHLARRLRHQPEGRLIIRWLLASAALVAVLAGLLRWRRPTWYWLAFGAAFATLRVLVRYSSVMDACGLTVPPPRWRLAIARMANRPVPEPRAPRIRRLRPTRTGLILRLGLRPGQDAFDVAASCDRLRHSFGMYGVTSREIRSGVVELRMTGYDVLKRVRLPDGAERTTMKVPVALREDGAVHYRDYRTTPHALTIGATKSGKSVYQRNLVAELASQDVALGGDRLQARGRAGPSGSPLLRPRR